MLVKSVKNMKNKTKVKKSRNGLKGAANAVLLWCIVYCMANSTAQCVPREK